MFETELQNDPQYANVFVQLYNDGNESMNFVVDTSAIISVITNEKHKKNQAGKISLFGYAREGYKPNGTRPDSWCSSIAYFDAFFRTEKTGD